MLKRFFPLLLLIFLFWCESVNAESTSDIPIHYYSQQYKVGNGSWVDVSTSYTTIPANSNLSFKFEGNFAEDSHVDSTSEFQPSVFGRLYLCSDQNMSTGWTSNSSSSDSKVWNIWFYNTNIPCNYYNSTYASGKLWIGNYTLYPKYSNGWGFFNYDLITHFDNTASIQYYSNILSFNQFEPYAYESGSYKALQEILNVLTTQNTTNNTIVSQNQTIISQNDTINNSINGVSDSVDNVNDSVNAVNDSINDSDTTGAGSSGSAYFGSFHINDNRGFSNILTAPIRLIQGILNGTNSCTPLKFDISLKHNSIRKSNEVSLPCGSILWNNVPSTASLLYQITIFGLFSWYILSDMYKFIDSIRDPDNKSEFVMKL